MGRSIFLKIACIFVLFLLIPINSIALQEEEQKAKADNLWKDWMVRYPDSVDYEGVPLKMLAQIQLGGLLEEDLGQDSCDKLQLIIERYPKSKIIPFVKYISARNDSNNYKAKLNQLIAEHANDIFPSVVSVYNTAWIHYPIPGVRIGPIAQLKIAESYGDIIWNKEKLEKESKDSLSIIVKEWKKVLDYYPNRLKEDTITKDSEFGSIIYIAYFNIIEIYILMGDYDNAEKYIDEILKNTNKEFGDNYLKNSIPEALLVQARIDVIKGNYNQAIKSLKTIINNYPEKYWGVHAGYGENYIYSAINEGIKIMPFKQQSEFVEGLINNNIVKGKLDANNYAILKIYSACIYEEEGEKLKARNILRDLVAADPKKIQDVLLLEPDKFNMKYIISNYFPTYSNTGATLLKDYVESLLKELKAK